MKRALVIVFYFLVLFFYLVLALKCALSCISVWCVFNVDLEQTLIGGLAIQLTLSFFKQFKKKSTQDVLI